MAVTALTRRGRVVLGVCLVGTVMALVVGGRSLNAVVIPGVVALVAAYLQVSRVDPPGAVRSGLTDGFVGETHEIRIEFNGGGLGIPVEPPFVGLVADRLDEGLVGPDEEIRTAIGNEPATYEVRYQDRGGQGFGPIDVAATDVLGLFRKRMVLDSHDRVVLYPECYPVPAWFRRGLYADDALGESRQREEFDRLREYARGDSLRDVHWPATAKHDDLVVKEFAAETERRRVSIVGGTGNRRATAAADVLARASASLALSLLDDGIPVDLSLPAGEVDAEPGRRGRRTVLELAARTGTGTISDSEEVDVRIEADTADARIHANGTAVDFSALTTEAEATAAGTTEDGNGPVVGDADGVETPGDESESAAYADGGTDGRRTATAPRDGGSPR